MKSAMRIALKVTAFILLASALTLSFCMAAGLFRKSGAAAVLSMFAVLLMLACLWAGGGDDEK